MTKKTCFHKVKNSNLHGKGVFATKNIAKGTTIFEYLGDRITPEQADEKANLMDYDDPSHTFFFSISNGMVIDGGVNGNDARFINHSCEPNCEAQENETGDHVYIVALKNIKSGDELTFDYGLIIDDELTPDLEQQYMCLCASPKCRGTMLAKTIPDISEADLKLPVLKAKRLTAESFAPFGDVIQASDSVNHFEINEGNTIRYHDLADIQLDNLGKAIVSIFRGKKRELPFKVTMMERHPLASQAFIPCGNNPWLVLVAPANEQPCVENIELFYCTHKQGVNYAAGVWHHPLMALHETSDFIVIDRSGPGDNCDIVQLEQAAMILPTSIHVSQ